MLGTEPLDTVLIFWLCGPGEAASAPARKKKGRPHLAVEAAFGLSTGW